MTADNEDGTGLTLSRVAQAAEILASMGVIATLLFLAAEVRQNTRITQAAAYERRIEDLNQWRTLLVTEPEVATIWLKDSEDQGVSQGAVADLRLAVFLHMQWAIYENAYYANQRGLLGMSEWSRFERQTCVRYRNDSDGNRWSTGRYAERQYLTEEFARFVEESCV